MPLSPPITWRVVIGGVLVRRPDRGGMAEGLRLIAPGAIGGDPCHSPGLRDTGDGLICGCVVISPSRVRCRSGNPVPVPMQGFVLSDVQVNGPAVNVRVGG